MLQEEYCTVDKNTRVFRMVSQGEHLNNEKKSKHGFPVSVPIV